MSLDVTANSYSGLHDLLSLTGSFNWVDWLTACSRHEGVDDRRADVTVLGVIPRLHRLPDVLPHGPGLLATTVKYQRYGLVCKGHPRISDSVEGKLLFV